MSMGQAIQGISADKLRRILETDSWTLEELEAAVAETNDPEKLKLLIAAIERLLERVRRLKKQAEERLGAAAKAESRPENDGLTS